jgi:hypothetical protein
MRDAILTFLEHNELECKAHQKYSHVLKEEILDKMVQLKKQLKLHKDNWRVMPEMYKKQMKEASEKLEKEKSNFKYISS